MAGGESSVLVRLRMIGASQFSSDAKRASGSLDDVGKSAKNVGTRFQGVKSAFGTAAVYAKRAAIGAVAAGGAAAVMGVKYDAALEQSQVSFKGLLGSQRGAERMMRRLQKFAAETPFEQAQLVSAAQRWVGVGNSAKSVIPSMRAVGDAVASVGGAPEDVMGVVTALTQMQNKGKASSEELQQIAERNIPAFKILAKQMGLTGAQLSEKLKKGQIKANTAVGALLKGMEGQYKGAMEAQSRTFNGMMSTLKDNASIILGIAFKPLFNYIKDKLFPIVNRFMTTLVKAGQKGGLKGMVDALKEMKGGKGAEGVIGTIAGAIAGLVEVVRNVDWGSLLDSIKQLGPVISGAATAAGSANFGSVFGSVVKVAGPFSSVINTIIGLLEKFLALPGAPQLLGGLLAVAAAMKVANAATGGLVGGMAKMGGQAFQMANTLATLITQIIAYRTAKLLGTGATVADTGAQAANTAAITTNNSVQQMGTLQLIRYRVAQIASKVATLAASAATKAWAAVQWLLNAALSANPIGLVVIAIGALVAGLVLAYTKSETFRNIVQGAFRAVKNAAVSAFNWVKKNWPTLLAIITGPIGLAVLAVVKNFDRIKGAARTVWTTIKSIFGRVKSFLTGLFSDAGGFVSGIGRGIADWLNANTPFGDRIEFRVFGKSVGFTIPALATGGVIQRSGWATVGEKGPELAHFPAGSEVYSNAETRAAARRGPVANAPIYITANLHLSGRQIHSEVFRVERAQTEMA